VDKSSCCKDLTLLAIRYANFHQRGGKIERGLCETFVVILKSGHHSSTSR
jgi:hypothetical protein